MLKKSLAAATLAMGAASAANAVTIDFTDASIWTSGASTQTVGGVTVSLASASSPIVVDFAGAPGAVGALTGTSDGLGVTNDEITFGTRKLESIIVSFSKSVRVVGLYFLDIFEANDGSDIESAIASFSGGESVVTFAQVPNVNGIGYAENFFSGILADSVAFTAGAGNDAVGRPDFALAGIEIELLAPIPLPNSALLFATAMVGFGALSRRRRATA